MKISGYKYLWILCAIYILVTISSDFELKLIDFFGLHTAAGILLFTGTFVLISVISEVYGYRISRLTIWLGALCCAIFILFAQIMILVLPADTNLTIPVAMMKNNSRIFASTIFTLLIAENINAFLVTRLKILFRGKYMGMRFVMATLIATGISIAFFYIMAFYGKVPFKSLLLIVFTSWMYRFISELVLTIFATRLAYWLKQVENIDAVDQNNRFALF